MGSQSHNQKDNPRARMDSEPREVINYLNKVIPYSLGLTNLPIPGPETSNHSAEAHTVLILSAPLFGWKFNGRPRKHSPQGCCSVIFPAPLPHLRVQLPFHCIDFLLLEKGIQACWHHNFPSHVHGQYCCLPQACMLLFKGISFKKLC